MPEEYTTYKPEWIDKEKQTDSKFASFVMTGITKSNEELRRATDATRSARPPKMTIDDYVEGVLAGDRMKLSRAITMVESNAPKHYTMAQDIVQRLLPYTGRAIRVGITGVPGAGKSTIIEALGTKLCQAGHKVAVLAVDPSSSVTGGAILGDKTRMEQLAKEPNALPAAPWAASPARAGRPCSSPRPQATTSSWWRPWAWARARPPSGPWWTSSWWWCSPARATTCRA